MRKIEFLIGFFAILSDGVFAQAPLHPLYTVLHGPLAYSIKQAGHAGYAANPASLAFVQKTDAGIFSEKRYMLQSFSSSGAVVTIPFHPGAAGITADYSMAGTFKAANLQLGYGLKLGERAGVGVSFKYHQLGVSGYGNASVISAAFGAIFQVNDQLQTGFSIQNPAGGRFGKSGVAYLPVIYSFGCGLDASEKLYTGFEIVKAESQPLQVNACFRYRIAPVCLLSGGISSASSQVWAGAGLQLRPFRLEIAACFHRQLGITPVVGIFFSADKKSK